MVQVTGRSSSFRITMRLESAIILPAERRTDGSGGRRVAQWRRSHEDDTAVSVDRLATVSMKRKNCTGLLRLSHPSDLADRFGAFFAESCAGADLYSSILRRPLDSHRLYETSKSSDGPPVMQPTLQPLSRIPKHVCAFRFGNSTVPSESFDVGASSFVAAVCVAASSARVLMAVKVRGMRNRARNIRVLQRTSSCSCPLL